MKASEKILAIIIVLGLILKFNLIAGGNMIVFFAMTILACVYFPLGVLLFNQIRLRHISDQAAYANATAPKIILSFVAGLGLSTIVIGSLFKLLNYEGADSMLRIGLIVTAAVFIISLTTVIWKKDTTSKFILWRVGIVGIVGLILMLTSPLSIVKLQYRDHPAYIEAFRNRLADPNSEELNKKVDLEYNRIRLTEEEFKRYEESVKEKTGG